MRALIGIALVILPFLGHASAQGVPPHVGRSEVTYSQRAQMENLPFCSAYSSLFRSP
jgi:hypothetical protein